MVKTYLNRLVLLIIAAFALFVSPVHAQSYSEFFIKISDAKTALQNHQADKALTELENFQQAFVALEESKSKAGQEVLVAVADSLSDKTITEAELTNLSKQLLQFEQEQNPVDYETELEKFENKVFPALERLRQTISGVEDREELKTAFLAFNSVWTRHEARVRPTIKHYGRIETALSFLRAAIETDPLDKTLIISQLNELETALKAFVSGEDVAAISTISSLSQGIATLEAAVKASNEGNLSKGQQQLREFILAWPSFESAVSTRNASLYRQVESQIPIIMAKFSEKDSQQDLRDLISQLKTIDTTAAYTPFDSMLILLREGVEALLIVLSLVGVLRSVGQKKGLRWVYGGAVAGLVASAVTAWLLHQLFPTFTSGANREILEGFIGIFAVVMMLTIGMWLHRKSQATAWQAYMTKQLSLVMSTGSFFSMFLLSFLAVFREGAEAILFYAGMLPHISLPDFLVGIGLALACLLVLTVIFLNSAKRLPINRLFYVLGWLIYGLAFKMLGVSIHTLQLTNQVSSHHITWLPSIDWLGIYPSWEVVLLQIILILAVAVSLFVIKSREA
ncbi:FTR1 family protein [Streptococcus sp. E17BB]|uniref:FTR1 family iron permease n=1 Tax=Streptococcus sp. E17BB TaxID=3278714 RepID=UPI00359E775D